MFKLIEKQGGESDKGFIVQRRDRFTIDYTQGNKTLSLNIESRSDGVKSYVTVFDTPFTAWNNGMPISKAQGEEIIKNFTEAMAFQDMKVIIA